MFWQEQWQIDKGTRAAGDRVSWGPDQCVAVMVSSSTDLLGSAAQDPQFLGWSSAGIGLSAGSCQEQDLCLCFLLLLGRKLEVWWLHHLSELSSCMMHAGHHGQAFPAMLLELGFWESHKAWLQGPGEHGHQAFMQSRDCSS